MNAFVSKIVIAVCLNVAAGLMLSVGAAEPWFASIYYGRASDNRFIDIVGTAETEFIDSHMAAFAVGKELMTYKDTVRLEVEGQITKHWGVQDHAEVNAVFVLRWLPFCWDEYLDTNFGIGNGLSYASDIPVLETDESEKTSRLLNYLMLEFAFVVPKRPDWDLFFRLHHRSGVFGLFNGVTEGSNLLCVGFRYRL